MRLPKHIVRQLAKPSGILGRLIIWRLNTSNHGMNASTFEALDIQKGDRVLEIGFGGGALLQMLLSSEQTHVAGVEISDLALEAARRRLAKAVESGHLTLESIQREQIPFPSAAFTKACCVNVVYFWDDISAMMSEVHRVLRPGGCFVVCYQAAGPNSRKTPPEDIEHYLRSTGFDVRATRRERDAQNGEYYCTTAQAAGRD